MCLYLIRTLHKYLYIRTARRRDGDVFCTVRQTACASLFQQQVMAAGQIVWEVSFTAIRHTSTVYGVRHISTKYVHSASHSILTDYVYSVCTYSYEYFVQVCAQSTQYARMDNQSYGLENKATNLCLIWVGSIDSLAAGNIT